MNYSEQYTIGTQELAAAGISEAALDARLLLEFITGHDRNTLLAHPDTPVSDEEAAAYAKIISLRASRIPLQQLTGTASFMGIDFAVDDKVLIPRQDSECLVEEAMRYTDDGSRILDLCTGSGCLLLSLMHYKNGCRGLGVDISEDAIKVSNRNKELLDEINGLNGGTVSFVAGDMFDAIPSDAKFDVIISNPPYIRSDVIKTLMPEVRDHEPHLALDGGDDGLTFYRLIAKHAGSHLVKEGRIFLEIGYDQGAAVSDILAAAGFSDIDVIKDYGNNDRVVEGKISLQRH